MYILPFEIQTLYLLVRKRFRNVTNNISELAYSLAAQYAKNKVILILLQLNTIYSGTISMEKLDAKAAATVRAKRTIYQNGLSKKACAVDQNELHCIASHQSRLSCATD